MSTETNNAGPGTSSDSFHACTQDVEDFFTRFRSLITHQGIPQIGNVLSQVTDLRHNHDSLMEETQRLRNAHQQEIAKLEERDMTFRQKSLKDYTKAVEGISKEKDRLSRENENLKMQIEQQIIATQAAERLHKTQAEAADILSKKMQEREEGANAAHRKLQESQKKLNDAQQSTRKFDDILKRRDQIESKLKEEAATARNEAQDQNKRSDRLQKRLDKIKGYLAPPIDVALTDLLSELDQVWQDSLKLVKSAVAANLPESTLKNKTIWQNIEKLAQALPLPRTNSLTAKSMRATLTLSVLAKACVRYIFTTTYILAERGELDRVLSLLAEQNSNHEYFIRSVLLGLCSNDDAQMIRPRVARMVDEVTSLIQDIIPPEALESFKSGLHSHAEKSAQVWAKFQRCEIHFKAACDVDGEAGWEWKTSKVPLKNDEAFGDLISCGPEDAVLTLFPQVLSVDDVEDKSIFPGIVVKKSQLEEAEQEEKQERASLAVKVESQPSRSRRRIREGTQAATSGAIPNGFLGGR